jgi:hypothetical protein
VIIAMPGLRSFFHSTPPAIAPSVPLITMTIAA